MYDERVIWHESGHVAVASALGRTIHLATAEPGERWSGMCSFSSELVRGMPPCVEKPLIAWPAGWQRTLAGDVAIFLAGDLGAELFGPRPATGAVRLPDDVTSMALANLERRGRQATGQELAAAAAAVNAPALSDAAQVAGLAYAAHGGDPPRAGYWVRWCAEECRTLLLQNEPAVRRVAAALAEFGTLGRAAVAAALRGEVAGNG